jgi:hypothetical protein
MVRLAARLEIFDPGFARTRRGARTACATVLSWATLAAVTSVLGVAEPLRITLFGAGACFFGALLVTDPQRSDRVRTFGWASVVSAVAIGALTTFLAGAGHSTSDRIGWFVLASTVGFAWLAVLEYVILPDDPLRSLKRSVDAFCQCAGDALASVVDSLNTTRDGTPSDRARNALHKGLARARSFRGAIDSQLSGALTCDFSQHDIEQLRVALYSTQKGLEEMADLADDPDWMQRLPDQIAWSIGKPCTHLPPPFGMMSTRSPGTPSHFKLRCSVATFTTR